MHYALYRKIFIYTCTILVGSVFICVILYVWNGIILAGSVFIPVVFHTRYTGILRIQSVPSSCLRWSGARVTLPSDIVFRILFPSTVTVSGPTDMTLNGVTDFENSSVEGLFIMRADSVICVGWLSTMWHRPRRNCRVCCTVLSKLSLNLAWAVLSLGVCLLQQDVQLAKELVPNGNWLWQLCHIFWDCSDRILLYWA